MRELVGGLSNSVLFQDVKMVIGQIWMNFHKLYLEKQKSHVLSRTVLRQRFLL